MDFKYKLVAVAVIALLSGTAFAAPMLIVPLDIKPYPQVQEGPKADFSIDILYANFSVNKWTKSEIMQSWTLNTTTWQSTPVNITRTDTYTNVTYMVVANVTNHSDMAAKLYETNFVAAQTIRLQDSALGGVSLNQGPSDLFEQSFGGVVDGIWLDGKWLNLTWVAGKDYPYNLYRVMNQDHHTLPLIPDLPAHATAEGTWIEGVPIAEYYDSNHLAATQIYINGVWVDVTGRVQPNNPQPMAVVTNTAANLVLTTCTPKYQAVDNTSAQFIVDFPSWGNGVGQTYRWVNVYGAFDSTWQPHQSKLVAFTGSQLTYSPQGVNTTADTLETGAIDLYGSITSYLNRGSAVNGTYSNTFATANWLETVPLQKTADGNYLYNAILAPNQQFVFSPNKIEVNIREANQP
jgi:hypothetical protein